NEEEAKVYTGTDSVEKAREVLKEGASQFVITRGKEGALIYDGDTFIDIEPYPVKAIDTNGAGDMYAGAFLYGITNGFGYAGAVKLASMAGSQILVEYGRHNKRGEVKELVKEATSYPKGGIWTRWYLQRVMKEKLRSCGQYLIRRGFS